MLWPAMGSPTPGSSPGSGISRERPEMPNFLNIFLMIFFQMSWNFGRFGRNFRRLWKIFAFSQLISPVVACIAILTASALGLDTDDIQVRSELLTLSSLWSCIKK